MTKCEKCGHDSDKNFKRLGLNFCEVCIVFAPNEPDDLDKYTEEKFSREFSEELEKFRKYAKPRGEQQKLGMIKKSSKGFHMSRVPFGYKRNPEGKLIPNQNYREIEEIFEEFIKPKTNLSKLAEKHSLSVNGIKKILKNFAYVGKIKFDGQIHNAEHQPLISSTLFNKVQDKLDKIEKSRKKTNS